MHRWFLCPGLYGSRLSGRLCCCVSFWFWRLRPEKKVLVVCLAGCAVVSVFGSGGKKAVFLLWQESFITTGKKVLVVCLAGCAVVSVFGSGNYNRKKSSSRLSGGLRCCVSFWFWREIGSFFVVVGKSYYNRKIKFYLSGRLCCCVSF